MYFILITSQHLLALLLCKLPLLQLLAPCSLWYPADLRAVWVLKFSPLYVVFRAFWLVENCRYIPSLFPKDLIY